MGIVDVVSAAVRRAPRDDDTCVRMLNGLSMSDMLTALATLGQRGDLALVKKAVEAVGKDYNKPRLEVALNAAERRDEYKGAPARFFQANGKNMPPFADQQLAIRHFLVERRTRSYRMSEAGKRFLASDPIEGFRPKLYNDNANNCTIGIGTLVHRGPCNGTEPAEFKRGITVDRALQLVASHLARFESEFNRVVKVELAQHQTDALLSFCYNAGGLHELLGPLNDGQFEKLPDLLPVTRVGGNAVVRMRRRNEARLFESANYASHY